MTTIERIKRSRISGAKLLVAAMAASLAWHLFWLSAIRVASPAASSQARFSKVSFLGPLLAGVSMEVRPEKAELSLLERRRLASVAEASNMARHIPKAPSVGDRIYVRESGEADAYIARLAEEAVGHGKVEPSFGAY
jgi:hypothetical protein